MYSPYLNNQYYPNYNMYQPVQRQAQDVIFNDIKFVTEDEAKAHIVFPNSKVLLIDKDKPIFYIKSADTLGKSSLKPFKYDEIINNSTSQFTSENTPLEFVKTSDFNPFIEQLNLLKQEMEDLKGKLNEKVEVVNE